MFMHVLVSHIQFQEACLFHHPDMGEWYELFSPLKQESPKTCIMMINKLNSSQTCNIDISISMYFECTFNKYSCFSLRVKHTNDSYNALNEQKLLKS